MQRLTSPAGATVSYDQYGRGPPLVLVHGSFSDHKTNWKFVKPLFETQFTVYAIARRGRGETDATQGHSLEDESSDVVAVIQSIGEPVFLLGHSYGAQTALAAATNVPRTAFASWCSTRPPGRAWSGRRPSRGLRCRRRTATGKLRTFDGWPSTNEVCKALRIGFTATHAWIFE
jgi:pimeloyl-ACP methyl ester carboxylesterase